MCEMYLEEQRAPGSVLCGRNSDNLHTVCTSEQPTCYSLGIPFPGSASPGQPQENVLGIERKKCFFNHTFLNPLASFLFFTV